MTKTFNLLLIYHLFRNTLWNTLPDDITSVPSLSVFRHKVKTFLFHKSYLDIISWPVLLTVFPCCATVVGLLKFPT